MTLGLAVLGARAEWPTARGDAGQLDRVSAPAYLEELVGTIGADPSAVG